MRSRQRKSGETKHINERDLILARKTKIPTYVSSIHVMLSSGIEPSDELTADLLKDTESSKITSKRTLNVIIVGDDSRRIFKLLNIQRVFTQ